MATIDRADVGGLGYFRAVEAESDKVQEVAIPLIGADLGLSQLVRGPRKTRSLLGSRPQRLKPHALCGDCGTTEVVPFPSLGTSSMIEEVAERGAGREAHSHGLSRSMS